MMKRKKKVIHGSEIILIILIAIASIYSFFCAREIFLSISLAQALTLLVAIGIAFHATQYRNDERKVKEQIEKVLEKMQTIVTDPSFYTFKITDELEGTKNRNRMMTRKLSNCINVLAEYSKDCGLEKEIDYLRREYQEYNELVSDHINDMDYLAKSVKQLKLHAENIDSKCDYITVALYRGKTEDKDIV